jgi:hypothetical protein
MIKSSKRIVKLIFSFLICVVISSCKKDSVQLSEVSVYLQDAPAPSYEKIKVEVKGVSVYSQTSGSWVTLTVNNGIFDLLTLDSLNQAFLGKIKLSGGDISQVQLIIGSNNSVTLNGIDYPLVLDAADLDKLKVKIDNVSNNGSFYKMTIDFKASESIDSSGNIYKLKASLKITVKSV